MTPPETAAFRIGDWIADPAANELRRGKRVVKVEPRAMDVLACLAARAGEIVTREALFTAAWPGAVVGDEALTQAIAKLRRALGDDAREAAYIETVAKRGYRLVAPVSRPAVAAPRATAGPRRPLAMVIGGVAAALGLTLVAVVVPWRAESPPSAAADEASDPRAGLTVLPFETLGPGQDNAYLARGITDGLLMELGRVPQLRVIRAASERGIDPRVARYVVGGSVVREGERLRIHVHLRDAASGEQVWSESFDRAYGDLFAVQDDLLRQLVHALPARVGDVERGREARRYTQSLEAYDLFLRARQLFLARTPADNLEARALYRRAVEIDPRFARAYAGLAMTYAIDHRAQWSTEDAPGLARALELARTAAQIDPDVAEIQWALGFVLVQGRRHEEAIEALQSALAIDRSFADAYALLAGIHTYLGEPARTIPLMRLAMRYNPEAGYLYYLNLARAYLFEGDYEQALINVREALRRNPVDVESRAFHAAALVAAGQRGAAQWEAQELRSLQPGFTAVAWLERFPLRSEPHRERLRAWLEEAGL